MTSCKPKFNAQTFDLIDEMRDNKEIFDAKVLGLLRQIYETDASELRAVLAIKAHDVTLLEAARSTMIADLKEKFARLLQRPQENATIPKNISVKVSKLLVIDLLIEELKVPSGIVKD